MPKVTIAKQLMTMSVINEISQSAACVAAIAQNAEGMVGASDGASDAEAPAVQLTRSADELESVVNEFIVMR